MINPKIVLLLHWGHINDATHYYIMVALNFLTAHSSFSLEAVFRSLAIAAALSVFLVYSARKILVAPTRSIMVAPSRVITVGPGHDLLKAPGASILVRGARFLNASYLDHCPNYITDRSYIII
ncbi:MAG: hypothetical protein IH840_11635 [Candidatus Heimdallarchaeota archaeon]|nr:hypothetical protein [Candidatus Heimdallarchaeota archaeon]